MDLYFDGKETELLMRLLEQRLVELHREIHHTDNRTFKAELKADEAILRGLQAKLRQPAPMGF